MKIRSGFVSNSSSSSFIVFGGNKTALDIPSFVGQTLVVGEKGQTEFGWEPEEYFDFHSRLNFTYLQAMYTDDTNMAMLEKVLRENTGCTTVETCMSTRCSPEDGRKYSYVDHQSAGYEGVNLEMFESEERLCVFLFNPGSGIHVDNDNY